MLARGFILQRSLQQQTSVINRLCVPTIQCCLKRNASTLTTATDNAIPSALPFMFSKQGNKNKINKIKLKSTKNMK